MHPLTPGMFPRTLRAASLHPRTRPSFCMALRAASLQPLTPFCLLHVIASQCAHWCGNPFSPQGNLAGRHYFGQIRMHFPVFALGAALCFVLPQENGLSRRFAPRNDRGGGVIANQCLAPADTRHVSAHLARRVLTPARTSFLLHVIARRVLATADTLLSSACHCEPVRTLAWQSVLLAVGHDRKQHFRRIRSCLRICPNSSQTG